MAAVARRDFEQGDTVQLDPANPHAVEPGRVGARAAHPEDAERVRAAPRIGRGGPDAPQRACERAAVLGLAVLERAVVDVAEALEREARARMDADTAVDGRMRKLENATLGVAERHAKALETLITYTYPFQQRGVSMS